MKITEMLGKHCLKMLKLKVNVKDMFFLSLAVLLLSSLMCTLQPFSAYAGSGRSIDLFCQKPPYGVGINQSGGTFKFREQIILYALVTYNEYPVENKIVSFEVHGPANPFENITFFRTALTNASGIAQITFKIEVPSEDLEEIFTETWLAIAVVDIAEQRVVDALPFQLYNRVGMFHHKYSIFLETSDIFL